LWGKKDKHCNPAEPADKNRGSWWDHVLIEPESKLVVTLVVGRRTNDTAFEAWVDFYQRTDYQRPELITTDEYAVYFNVIVCTYGRLKEELEPLARERLAADYAAMPPLYFPVEITYATVQKKRVKGRVVRVEPRIVLGTAEQAAKTLSEGSTAPTINVNYVERWHGTNRHFNARKARKVYTFSKDILFHIAVTWLVVVMYNWCWTPRTLREKVQAKPPRYRQRTPAMAAGLTEEPWTLMQILAYPIYRQCDGPQKRRKRRRRKSKRKEGG
jgi:hypothetical protein